MVSLHHGDSPWWFPVNRSYPVRPGETNFWLHPVTGRVFPAMSFWSGAPMQWANEIQTSIDEEELTSKIIKTEVRAEQKKKYTGLVVWRNRHILGLCHDFYLKVILWYQNRQGRETSQKTIQPVSAAILPLRSLSCEHISGGQYPAISYTITAAYCIAANFIWTFLYPPLYKTRPVVKKSGRWSRNDAIVVNLVGQWKRWCHGFFHQLFLWKFTVLDFKIFQSSSPGLKWSFPIHGGTPVHHPF